MDETNIDKIFEKMKVMADDFEEIVEKERIKNVEKQKEEFMEILSLHDAPIEDIITKMDEIIEKMINKVKNQEGPVAYVTGFEIINIIGKLRNIKREDGESALLVKALLSPKKEVLLTLIEDEKYLLKKFMKERDAATAIKALLVLHENMNELDSCHEAAAQIVKKML